MASEQEFKKLLDEKFQRCYEKAVLDIVCHSSDNMEKLVDRCFLKLHGEYFPGEPVLFRSKSPGKQIKGVIVKQDGNLKQEEAAAGEKVANAPATSAWELSYTVLVGTMEVNGVPERDLARDHKLPSKELIKIFIKTYAIRNTLTKNWRLTSDEKAAEYGLKTGSQHPDVNQLLMRQQQQKHQHQKQQYQDKSPVLESSEASVGATEEHRLPLPVKVGSDVSSTADSAFRNNSTKGELPNGQALNGNTVDGKLKVAILNGPAVIDPSHGYSKQQSGGKSTDSPTVRKSNAAAIDDQKLKGKGRTTMDGYVIPKSKTPSSETSEIAFSKATSTHDSTEPGDYRTQPAADTEPCVLRGPILAVPELSSLTKHCPSASSVVAKDAASGFKLRVGGGVASGSADVESSSDSVSVWDSDDDMVLSVVKKQITPSKKDVWTSKVNKAGAGSMPPPQESCKRSLLSEAVQRPKVKKERKKVKALEGKRRKKTNAVNSRADSSSDDDVALIAYKNTSMPGSKTGGDQDGLQKKVGLKQTTLFDLSKKASSTIQSPGGAATVHAPQQPTIPEVVQKYQKAEAELDFPRMQQLLLQAASDLSAQQRDSLPANMKAAVREKHEYLELKKKMKFVAAEEKAVIQKQLHAYRLKEAAVKRRVQQLRCEDTDLDLKPLPTARPVELPSDAVTFADVVCVTEFIRCYHGLLAPGSSWDDKKMSAEMLMLSLVRASAGDAQAVALVGEIMTMLLQTLVSDEELKELKVLGVPIRDVPVNVYTVSEMARLLLCRSIRGTSTDAATAGADADDPKRMDNSGAACSDAACSGGIAEDLLARLSSCEFPALTPEQNLAILSSLCDRVLCSRSAETYVEDKHQECADAWKQRKAEAKLLNPKKLTGEKQGNAPDGVGTQHQLSKATEASKVAVPAATSAGAIAMADPGGGDHAVDSDVDSDRGAGLTALLRQRREQAAKSARERERKLQQERIQREQEAEVRRLIKQREAIEKQFNESVTSAKEVLRCRPLGFDRNHNRYWHFASAKPGIYVEQGWVGTEMTYHVQLESPAPNGHVDATPAHSVAMTTEAAASASATVAGTAATADHETRPIAEKAATPTLPPTQDLDLEKTFPQPGKNQWLVYDSHKDIDALLMALHPRGVRENALANSLRAIYLDLVRLMKASTNVGAASLPAASSTAAAAVAAAVVVAAPSARAEEQANAVVRFQEELEDLESRLLSGGLGGVNDFDSWSRSIHSTTDVNGLAACLIECGEAILPKFLKGTADSAAGQTQTSALRKDADQGVVQGAADQPMSNYFKPEDSAAAFCISKWKAAVVSTATLSRLHVLLGILEACVRWEKSAENAKCKVCRRKGNEDSLLLCDECNMAFHMHCLRPALIRVPEGEWFCPACKCMLLEMLVASSQKNGGLAICDKIDEPCMTKRESHVESQTRPALSLGSRDGSLASDDESDGSEASSGDTSDASDMDKDERADCCVCSESGHDLVVCSVCSAAYHLRCHSPPLRCTPVSSSWACSGCRATGEASSKKRGKQQQVSVTKDRRRGRREAVLDVSDKDLDYKSQDQQSDDVGDGEALPRTKTGKRLCSATDERRSSSAKTVRKDYHHVSSHVATGSQSRSRWSTARDSRSPAAAAAPKATRTLKSLRPIRPAAVETLIDDDAGSISEDHTLSTQPVLHSTSAKASRASTARSAQTVVTLARSTVGCPTSMTSHDDEGDEADDEEPGKGSVRCDRSRTGYGTAGRRIGAALVSECDRRSKRRVVSEDDCEMSASDEVLSNAGSSRRTRTGAAEGLSCRTAPSKRTVIFDDDSDEEEEEDVRQPAKRRLRSVQTESNTGGRRKSAARQSKQVAAAAIRNGYKSVSSESDSDHVSDKEASGKSKGRSKAASRKIPVSDDDGRMPHLEPEWSDDDAAAGVSKRKKSLSEDDVRATRKRPNTEDSAAEISILAVLLVKLLKHPSSADFEETVDPNEVPDYYDVIQQPITLGEIKAKNSKGLYSSTDAFISDITLLFQNAFEYNKVDSEVGHDAQRLEEEFVRLLGQHLPSQRYESQYKLFAAAAAARGKKASKRKR